MTETAESLVYRVAQESVRNVVRHARASQVQLIVAEEDGWIQLRVSDDGQGFDPSSPHGGRAASGSTCLPRWCTNGAGTCGWSPPPGKVRP